MSKNYTVKEKIKYHNSKAKKGALNSKGEPVSDFQRGVHKQKADGLIQNAKRYYKHKAKQDYVAANVNKESKVKK